MNNNQQATENRKQITGNGHQPVTPYVNTQNYLRDYGRLLALRLHREVLVARLLRGGEVNESFLGLFLSEPEVDQALAALHGVVLPYSDQTVDLEATILACDAGIATRRGTSNGNTARCVIAISAARSILKLKPTKNVQRSSVLSALSLTPSAASRSGRG